MRARMCAFSESRQFPHIAAALMPSTRTRVGETERQRDGAERAGGESNYDEI